MLTGDPLFPGDSDIDQLHHIVRCIGNLNEKYQTIFQRNPLFVGMRIPAVREVVPLERRLPKVTKLTLSFIKNCLRLDANERPTSSALIRSEYFTRDNFSALFLEELKGMIERDLETNTPIRQALPASSQPVQPRKLSDAYSNVDMGDKLPKVTTLGIGKPIEISSDSLESTQKPSEKTSEMTVTGHQLPLNVIQTQSEQLPSSQPTTISADLSVSPEERNPNQQLAQCTVSVDSTGSASHDTTELESISQLLETKSWQSTDDHKSPITHGKTSVEIDLTVSHSPPSVISQCLPEEATLENKLSSSDLFASSPTNLTRRSLAHTSSDDPEKSPAVSVVARSHLMPPIPQKSTNLLRGSVSQLATTQDVRYQATPFDAESNRKVRLGPTTSNSIPSDRASPQTSFTTHPPLVSSSGLPLFPPMGSLASLDSTASPRLVNTSRFDAPYSGGGISSGANTQPLGTSPMQAVLPNLSSYPSHPQQPSVQHPLHQFHYYPQRTHDGSHQTQRSETPLVAGTVQSTDHLHRPSLMTYDLKPLVVPATHVANPPSNVSSSGVAHYHPHSFSRDSKTRKHSMGSYKKPAFALHFPVNMGYYKSLSPIGFSTPHTNIDSIQPGGFSNNNVTVPIRDHAPHEQIDRSGFTRLNNLGSGTYTLGSTSLVPAGIGRSPLLALSQQNILRKATQIPFTNVFTKPESFGSSTPVFGTQVPSSTTSSGTLPTQAGSRPTLPTNHLHYSGVRASESTFHFVNI
ncbi:hypothetical protein P879_06559 [Paragonimus westermani]|uniref:Protein kinase domain-containing protein n=1 Tax=Paragonimus westermani TaxID=34504 RepID=A0A8T0D3P5_9TREM|nr:hypothetical protein P879_06559 [Paragonimus westermani]